MSFLRASTRAGCRQIFIGNTRHLASPPTQRKASNLPLFLGGAGVVGLGFYVYMEYSSKSATQRTVTQDKSPLDPANFLDFKLKAVEPYNHNTSKFLFELPDNQASLLPVASCLLVKSSDPEGLKDAQGKPVVRPYTPISPSDMPGELTLLIKKYETGNMSRYIHSLSPGDKLSIKGPIPKWPYKINEFDEVALIGGGTGITPLYQVLSYALADKTNTTKFTLLFSNITEKDILLREELDKLQKKHPNNFHVIYVVDHPEKTWAGPTGFISSDLIKKHVAPPSFGNKVKIFICGPPGQVAAVAGGKAGMKQGELGGILKELGYVEDQVYKF